MRLKVELMWTSSTRARPLIRAISGASLACLAVLSAGGCAARGDGIRASVAEEAEQTAADETQATPSLPGVAFGGLPAGWLAPKLSSVSRRNGQVATREFTSWPTSELVDGHETVGICVTATEDEACAAPRTDVIRRIDVGDGITAVVHVIPRKPAVNNSADRQSWSTLTATLIPESRS